MKNLIFNNPAVGEIDLINDEYVRLTSITGVSNIGQINSQATAGLSGSTISSKVTPERQMLVSFRIRAGVDAEQAQHDIYRIFSALSEGTMTFVGRLGSSRINYVVQSCEIPPNQQEIKGLATLICPDPYFHGLSENSAVISGSVNYFQFPFTFPDHAFYISRRVEELFVDVQNDGEADTECTITFTASSEVVNPALIDVNTSKAAKIKITMQRGDIITITTGKNQKKVTLKRNEDVYNIFNKISYPFTFFTLAQGKNTFTYDADAGRDGLNIVMEWSAKYGAIYTNAPGAIEARPNYDYLAKRIEDIANIVKRNGLYD